MGYPRNRWRPADDWEPPNPPRRLRHLQVIEVLVFVGAVLWLLALGAAALGILPAIHLQPPTIGWPALP